MREKGAKAGRPYVSRITHHASRFTSPPPCQSASRALPSLQLNSAIHMKRRVFYGLLLGLLAVNLFVGAQVYFSNVQAAEKDDALPNLKLFSTVLDRVRQEYVDGDQLTYQKLIHDALKGMLNNLDPHSEFMDDAKYDELKKDTQGEFGGVGIQIQVKDGFLTVFSPMEGYPAYNAGILTGDRIIKIEGRPAERLNIGDAVKRLRGAKGTQ